MAWEYAARVNTWVPFSMEHCSKIDEALEKGSPTVLLSSNPVIFVNLRSFMLRNTSNNAEVGVRRRSAKTQQTGNHMLPKNSSPQKDVSYMKKRVDENSIALPHEFIAQTQQPSNIIKPGRFAIAWAAEIEECKQKVVGLTKSIIKLIGSFDDSQLIRIVAMMRELGSLLIDNAEARKLFSKQPAHDLAGLIACISLLLSSGNDGAQEWASAVLASMVQDEGCKALVQGAGPQLDGILAGLLRMVSGPAAASCSRQRHALFALNALTAAGPGQQRLLAVRRMPRAAR